MSFSLSLSQCLSVSEYLSVCLCVSVFDSVFARSGCVPNVLEKGSCGIVQKAVPAVLREERKDGPCFVELKTKVTSKVAARAAQ